MSTKSKKEVKTNEEFWKSMNVTVSKVERPISAELREKIVNAMRAYKGNQRKNIKSVTQEDYLECWNSDEDGIIKIGGAKNEVGIW